MKKLIALLLAVVLCLSLVACGSKPSDMVVDGKEISVTDFLIEHLNEYIQSEDYLAREALFEDLSGNEAQPFTVTRVIEVSADDLGGNHMSVHFLAVKADCNWAGTENEIYGDTLLIADYNTGVMYDIFDVDASWADKNDSMEQQIYYMLNGILWGGGYEGGTIIVDREERVELGEKEIAEINEALSK